MSQDPCLSLLPNVLTIGVFEAIFSGTDRPFGQEKIRPLRAFDIQIELRGLLLWLN